MTANTPDDVFLALLDRYLAGESNQEEAHQVREWLARDPENRRILEELEQFRSVIHSRPPVKSAEESWKRFKAITEGKEGGRVRSGEYAVPSPRRMRVPSSTTRSTTAWAAAAAALLITASGVLYYANLQPKPKETAAAESRRYVTSRGQRATIQLSDGSQLTIGPSSVVDLAADFGAISRDVTLSGEAYFKVKHDSARPFRVHTANGVAEDLGTEFVVSAFSGSGVTQVVVSSGKVALGSKTLTRGELGRIDRRGAVAISSGVDLDLYFGWIDGRLTFRDARLDQAISRLTRWYDIEFVLEDPALGKLPLTVSFKDESLSQVLEVLDLTLGLRHRMSGRRVIFYSANGRDQ